MTNSEPADACSETATSAGQENLPPAQVATGHARHYAALLAQEEPGTPGWQFVFGQLSAAATLANALREQYDDRNAS